MQTRRKVLAGMIAAGAAPGLGWAAVGNPVAISAAKRMDDSYALVGLDAAGGIAFDLPLPGRGHAAAAHPLAAEIVAIARRPGTFARVIDCASGNLLQKLAAPSGRHFYGHAAFSADGATLFTPENDYATGAGRIGVWDRNAGYARIGEFGSAGIGPHEIIRLPNGTLAVANGGIRTHPDSGREKLNLDTMRPNLSVFSDQGTLLDQAEPGQDALQNSLRHIAVQQDGTVACGFQWQGDIYDALPLVALYRGGGMLHPLEMDDGLLRSLDGYIGSVAALGTSGFAASSPRGGRVISFDTGGTLIGSYAASDVCGLAQGADGSGLVTDGHGTVYAMEPDRLRPRSHHPIAFDNHLVPVRI